MYAQDNSCSTSGPLSYNFAHKVAPNIRRPYWNIWSTRNKILENITTLIKTKTDIKLTITHITDLYTHEHNSLHPY